MEGNPVPLQSETTEREETKGVSRGATGKSDLVRVEGHSLVPSPPRDTQEHVGCVGILALIRPNERARAGGQEGEPPLFLKVSGMEAKQNRRARECEPGIPTIRLGAAREGGREGGPKLSPHSHRPRTARQRKEERRDKRRGRRTTFRPIFK